MNVEFSNERVYDAMQAAAGSFFGDLTGSVFRNYWSDKLLEQSYVVDGIQFDVHLKEFKKPNGEYILSNTRVEPGWLSSGSYFGIVEIKIPDEKAFSFQAPHNRPEDQFHVQKGREKREFKPSAEIIATIGMLGSGMWGLFQSKEEALELIDWARH